MIVISAIVRHAFSINVEYSSARETTERVETDVEDVATEDSVVLADIQSEPDYTEVSDDSTNEDVEILEDSIMAEEENSNNADSIAESDSDVRPVKRNRIVGVRSFDECFPDINDVQLQAARSIGINPVKDREEAQRLVANHELVNICNSPYYRVDDLSHSMPYLVPKAQHLLNTICMNFIDSVQAKGLPPHLPMVTSVLRTADDVSSLRTRNHNATVNSCHCYGTTVDISYNRYVPVIGYYDKDYPLTRWSYELKCILSEVLYDLRKEGKCYVKYERKQGCFHLTAR